MLHFRVVKCQEQKVSSWSGGSTTEIYLMPQDGSYAERRFDWRLSTATVERTESDFTALPGISRHLLILEGEIRLRHNCEPEVLLVPFQEHCFDGGWVTRSYGCCRDLNLMLTLGYTGELKPLHSADKVALHLTGEAEEDDVVGIYVLAEDTMLILYTEAGSETVALEPGDLWLLTGATASDGVAPRVLAEVAAKEQGVIAIQVRVNRQKAPVK